jgi:hypothetical protein
VGPLVWLFSSHAHARAVVLPQPEAVIDVDKPLDVELAKAILARREGLA